jgi:sec-independent protein translocase protein TatB
MLDVGFSEILLTSAIALIVLGPERLPKVARQVGNWMGRARAMARQLSEQLEREVSAEELLKTQSKPSPSANLPRTGAALDPYAPSVAPQAAIEAPATMANPPAVSTPPIVAPPPVKVPHPTSAAAMHAADSSPQAELFAADTTSASAGTSAPPHE